ncbi:lipopolysaccharide biosynthesis protein [Tengunoibacter tsumagoiensis]|nr:hypothetical protein [Tengunoibacter tsumagoiensis]
MLFNTGSLIGTMFVTSGLGFAYWLVAARYYPADAVGLASAATSAMMLLSSLFLLGQGTLLISEIPRHRKEAGALISASVILVAGCSLLGGIISAFLAPLLSPELRLLGNTPLHALLYALGVMLAAVTVILDQAVIGLLEGNIQLWRNTLFAVAKLVLLFVAAEYLSLKSGIGIYTLWTLGNAISFLPIIIFMIRKKKWSLHYYRPQWKLMRKFGIPALQHHVLNLILQAPTQLLPILVTIIISAKANAWFYSASMIANFVFSLSLSLTTVLHAANAAQTSTLTQKTRMTVGLSLLASLTVGTVLALAAYPILHVFGTIYAQEASWSLRILILASLPLIVKNHYIAICRIKDHIAHAIVPIVLSSVLELVGAAIGARLWGLTGLSLGWVLAMTVEALYMLPVVVQTLIGRTNIDQYLDAIAAQDTLQMPALNQFVPSGVIQLTMYGNTMALAELDTMQLPALRRSSSTPSHAATPYPTVNSIQSRNETAMKHRPARRIRFQSEELTDSAIKNPIADDIVRTNTAQIPLDEVKKARASSSPANAFVDISEAQTMQMPLTQITTGQPHPTEAEKKKNLLR